MTKKRIFCYSCEQEYTINYSSKDEPEVCCFCASALDDADKDEDEVEDWQLDE